ncbi:hypothetical protein [Vibrio marisflavi]|uniref:Uncharacterized protein n=1 Tax=Vibrio marisflavi CECT 7928 TaxID=634439 RepID=A0ABN8DWU6_9VIBR|nr:hypothetical protein [Vibrio marisflavi]CAH0536018.1 hypothetical protein VMF7928_00114 [Vibrio marisflavi CECT 7928]
MRDQETFHHLIKQLFVDQRIEFTPSDVYHLTLTSPQVDSILVAFFSIDDNHAAIVAEIRTPLVNISTSEWLLQRNSFKQQMAASYCLVKDGDNSSRVFAQIKFNYQRVDLPEMLALYQAFSQEIIQCSQALQTFNHED